MFGLFSNPRFIKIINDLFRDSNSKKTSLTRLLAIMLFFIVISGKFSMYISQSCDFLKNFIDKNTSC